MYLFMILLLLVPNIIIETTCNEGIQSKRNNTETVKSDDKNCVSFPGGQSLIPELSNHKSNGLERLVVYLYKNKYTDEVYVFQPNGEKQSLIPDIPYTPDDLLEPVTTETIVSLFTDYPNKIQTDQPANTKGDPIGLYIGSINHEAKPNWNIAGLPVKNHLNMRKRKKIVTSSLPSHSGWYPSQKQQQVHTQGNLKGQLVPTAIESNIIHPFIKPLDSSDFDDNSFKTDLTVNTNPGKETRPFNKEIHNIPLNPYHNKGNKKLTEINYSIHQGESNLPKRLSTFDDWFNEQMVTVQKEKTSKGVNKIDSVGLRSLVLKTLSDNNLYISTKGIMMDNSGTLIDLNNLELRLILIGSPVKLQALELNQQLTFPETLPYLEGILIMLVNPFRILGVIPVSKTYASSSSMANNANSNYNYKNTNSINEKTNAYFSNTPFHASLETESTVKFKNPFKLIERPESSVPVQSVFSENQRLPETLHVKLLDSKLTEFQNFVTKEPLTSKAVFKEIVEDDFQIFDTNGGGHSLSNVGVDSQKSDSQLPRLQAHPIKINLNVDDNRDLASDLTQKEYSNSDISTLKKSNPHLTAVPLKEEVTSQSNRNVQNINDFPIKSHGSALTNSFWYNVYPTNNIEKHSLDSSKQHLIPTPINEISESSSDSNESHLMLKPFNEVFETSAKQENSPGFSSKYFTSDPDAVTITDENQNIHLPHQQSSWFNEGLGDAILKSVPSVLNSEVTGMEIPNWNNLDDSENLIHADVEKNGKPTRRYSSPMLKGVLKTLFEMIVENLVTKNNPEGKLEEDDKESEVKVNTTADNPKALKYAENDEDVAPGFRIIGGLAATGSGSPLSNKGRNGLSKI